MAVLQRCSQRQVSPTGAANVLRAWKQTRTFGRSVTLIGIHAFWFFGMFWWIPSHLLTLWNCRKWSPWNQIQLGTCVCWFWVALWHLRPWKAKELAAELLAHYDQAGLQTITLYRHEKRHSSTIYILVLPMCNSWILGLKSNASPALRTRVVSSIAAVTLGFVVSPKTSGASETKISPQKAAQTDWGALETPRDNRSISWKQKKSFTIQELVPMLILCSFWQSQDSNPHTYYTWYAYTYIPCLHSQEVYACRTSLYITYIIYIYINMICRQLRTSVYIPKMYADRYLYMYWWYTLSMYTHTVYFLCFCLQ